MSKHLRKSHLPSRQLPQQQLTTKSTAKNSFRIEDMVRKIKAKNKQRIKQKPDILSQFTHKKL